MYRTVRHGVDWMGKSEDTALHITFDLSLHTSFLSVQENMAVISFSTL